jgi:hypothetical protein
MDTTDPVDNDEKITRFIVDGNDYRSRDNTVKESAFLPTKNNKTSVFRTNDLEEASVWGIGEGIAILRNRTLKGKSDFVAIAVYNAHINTDFPALSFEPDNTPTHHANIIGWPSPYNKEKSKVLAQKIAALVNNYAEENGTHAFSPKP